MSKRRTVRLVVDPDEPSTFPRSQTDFAAVAALTDAQIQGAAEDDPDAQPLTEAQLARMRLPMDARSVRGRLGLTQVAFALRFRIPLASVQAWERGRMTAADRLLLRLIDRDPQGAAEQPGPDRHPDQAPSGPQVWVFELQRLSAELATKGVTEAELRDAIARARRYGPTDVRAPP